MALSHPKNDTSSTPPPSSSPKRRRRSHGNDNDRRDKRQERRQTQRDRRQDQRNDAHNGNGGNGGNGGGGSQHKKNSPKVPFQAKKVQPTPNGIFDPTSAYGRTKDDAWARTKAGEHFATQNPLEYTSWYMGNVGGFAGPTPTYGGPTQFGQYLAGDYQNQLDQGYNAALIASGGRLGRADYLDSVGWGRGEQAMRQNSLVTPVNTGNPFSSSSLAPAGAPTLPPPVATAAPATALGQRVKKTPGNPNLQNGGGLATARRMYNSLTPQQRGINSATGFKPGRWATF